MTIERRNPLPAGRYWLDLPAESQPSFDAWRSENGVKTETTQTDASGWTWYLFRTAKPLPWRGEVWGLPNHAGAGVTTATDVMQFPEEEPDFPEALEAVATKAGHNLLVGAAVIVVGALVVNRLLR